MAWRTAHFTLEEFTRSDTADKLHIDNTPSADVVLNLCVLASQVLEPVRRAWRKPMIITSGYRSEELNKTVGGVKGSYHTKGMACDIRITEQLEGETLARFLNEMPLCDLCLIEHKGNSIWLHVQFRYEGARHRIDTKYKA